MTNKKHRIHNLYFIYKTKRDNAAIETDLRQVMELAAKFNYVSLASFKLALKACPWLEELYSKEPEVFEFGWSTPFYGSKKVQAMIKELKSIEPLVAKLRVAGVL